MRAPHEYLRDNNVQLLSPEHLGAADTAQRVQLRSRPDPRTRRQLGLLLRTSMMKINERGLSTRKDLLRMLVILQ